MTGTPLDLTHFGGLLTALGWVYWGAALAVLALAIWLPKGRRWKFVAAVAATALIYVIFVRPIQLRVQTQRAQQARVDEAAALFRKRCESAGEKISRTVENVEGIVWMKWRPPYRAEEAYDQFTLDDPYGRDCHSNDCIAGLLRVTAGQDHDPERASKYRTGYSFVESTEPASGAIARYTRVIKSVRQRTSEQLAQATKNNRGISPGPDVWDVALEATAINHFTARYGVTWDDISTREDREHWIAGGALKVIDLQTNEVIAERIGYMVDRGQGSREGFRMPWVMAERNACPAFPSHEGRYSRHWPESGTLFFVSKVLVPKETSR